MVEGIVVAVVASSFFSSPQDARDKTAAPNNKAFETLPKNFIFSSPI